MTVKIWYRDGYIITNDVSMMDVTAIESLNPNPSVAKVFGTFTEQFLVILTPTPLNDSQDSQIGFARVVSTREKPVPEIAELLIHREWRDGGLEKWLKQCAKELRGS